MEVTDSRRAMAYLVAPGSDDYIRIMAVLESSVTDLTPVEIAALVSTTGPPMDDGLVQKRLDKVKDWTAATGRSDPSRIRRHADILARNWRWTATPAGRQVHRFYTSVLAGTPTMREIPLPSLARIVDSVEQLATTLNLPRRDDGRIAELIGRLFTGHDDLDAALVGAEVRHHLTIVVDTPPAPTPTSAHRHDRAPAEPTAVTMSNDRKAAK